MPPPLRRGEVHVWRVRLDPHAAVAASLSGVLAGEERARAERFRSDVHRSRFVVCRAAQRDVLARYTGLSPAALRFRYSAYGKPALATDGGEPARIRFNVSNARDLAVVAVTADREVGVDVEAEREVTDALGLARRFFSPAELAALEAVPPVSMQRAFVTCWTRKEAFIKAIGLGVSMPLAAFDVAVDPDEPAALLRTRPDPAVALRWSMHALDVGPGYACTLVADGPVDAVRLFDWTAAPGGPAPD